MSNQTTCWTVIQGAADGVEKDVAAFVRLYAPVVRAYLGARWTAPPLSNDLEDAAQDVFLECFRDGGVLQRVDPESLGSFRAFLLGVTRNVSLRFEQRRGRKREVQPPTEFDPDHLPAEEEQLSIAFDRAWAQALLKEAVARQGDRARILGAEAERRVELLRLRFREGLKLRDIAERWQQDHAGVKRQNAQALREFEDALREVVAFHYPGLPAAGERELARLLALAG